MIAPTMPPHTAPEIAAMIAGIIVVALLLALIDYDTVRQEARRDKEHP
jgi:hypothetical protein